MKRIYKRKKVPFYFKHKRFIAAVVKSFKVVMAIMGMICFYSIFMIDSPTIAPFIIFVCSGLVVFGCAWMHDFFLLNCGEN